MSAPTCRQCGKKLAPTFETRSVRVDTTEIVEKQTGKILGYGYSRRGHFCSLRCGFRVDDERETWTLAGLIDANELDPEDVARLRALVPGEHVLIGGGGWAASTLTRVT